MIPNVELVETEGAFIKTMTSPGTTSSFAEAVKENASVKIKTTSPINFLLIDDQSFHIYFV